MTTETETSATERAPPARSGRRVVILGALSAIAVATARIYAGEGAKLLLVARNGERLERIAADLRARGAASVDTAAIDLACCEPSDRFGIIVTTPQFYGQ